MRAAARGARGRAAKRLIIVAVFSASVLAVFLFNRTTPLVSHGSTRAKKMTAEHIAQHSRGMGMCPRRPPDSRQTCTASRLLCVLLLRSHDMRVARRAAAKQVCSQRSSPSILQVRPMYYSGCSSPSQQHACLTHRARKARRRVCLCLSVQALAQGPPQLHASFTLAMPRSRWVCLTSVLKPVPCSCHQMQSEVCLAYRPASTLWQLSVLSYVVERREYSL